MNREQYFTKINNLLNEYAIENCPFKIGSVVDYSEFEFGNWSGSGSGIITVIYGRICGTKLEWVLQGYDKNLLGVGFILSETDYKNKKDN